MRTTAKYLLRLCALSAVLGTMAAANAQTDVLRPSFMGRLGFVYPLDSDVRDIASDFGFTVGLSYVLQSSPLFKNPLTPSTASIDLDYYRTNGNGNTLDSVDLMYAERVHLGVPEAMGGGFYLGGALGVAFAHASGNGFSERETSLAGQLLAGYMWSNSGMLEAYLRLAGDIAGVSQNAVGLRAGVRF